MPTESETLLQPISDAQPCGVDMMFSAEFDAIREARRHDDPSLDQGDWVATIKEADWPGAARLATELLRTRTKDIRLAAWTAEAWARTRGFAGLRDGLMLVAQLCDRFWDTIHPLPDDGDQQPRIGNLSWLLQRVRQLACEIPLTQSEAGDYAAIDWESAMALANAIKRTPDKAAELAQGKVTQEDFERARRDTPLPFYQALLADVPACVQAMAQLEAVVSRRLGDGAPAFSAARDSLHTVLALAQRFAREAGLFVGEAQTAQSSCDPQPASAAPESETGTPARDGRVEPVVPPMVAAAPMLPPGTAATAPTATQGIASREQALGLLREVAAFFRRTEPHSPVAYLADKAASWGGMSLHLWLRTVMKDDDTLARMEELLGVDPPKDG